MFTLLTNSRIRQLATKLSNTKAEADKLADKYNNKTRELSKEIEELESKLAKLRQEAASKANDMTDARGNRDIQIRRQATIDDLIAEFEQRLEAIE